MENNDPIQNRVASSSLISIDLEELYDKRERINFDLKENLFQGLILKEKDFREFLKNHDWNKYENKNVAVFCSEDAVIPTWAYMLVVSYLEPIANKVVVGTHESLEQELFSQAIDKLNVEEYRGAKVVVKGCSKYPVPVYAYGKIVEKLRPVVSSVMFGEPCSTVPVFKKK